MCWNALECAEDFQSYAPISVSARNCLMWNKRLPTASCAGVCWNAPECAGVGHNLGTNRSGSYWINWSARDATGHPRYDKAPRAAVSDNGRLCHGDGGPRTGRASPEGANVAYAHRRRRALMLAILNVDDPLGCR
jgi:hypothetical protein